MCLVSLEALRREKNTALKEYRGCVVVHRLIERKNIVTNPLRPGGYLLFHQV